MPRSNRSGERAAAIRDDRGAASLEFITVGVLLLVPLVYLVITLGQIQGHALGAEAGARQIARAIALAPDRAAALDRARTALRSVTHEYGIDAAVDWTLRCVPDGAECPRPGVVVEVSIRTTSPLPLAPSFLGLDRALAVPIEARAAQPVGRLWGEP